MKLFPSFEASAIGHEINNHLVPMVDERVHAISTSADQRVMDVALQDLGSQAIAEIAQSVSASTSSVIEQAPPVVDAGAQAVGDILGTHTVSGPAAVVQKEQQSGFWGDKPEDKRIVQTAGWDGDLAAVSDDDSKLRTDVTAEQFFQEDFQLMPQSVAEQPAPTTGNADYRTSQDVPSEAGFANPYVDETRLFLDGLDALPETTDPSILDNQSPEAIAARVDAARLKVSETV